MDIHAGVVALTVILIGGAFLSIWLGIRAIQAGRRVPFFRLRQRQVARGWRLIFSSIIWGILAFAVQHFGEPVAFQYYTPT
jgi:uncharacterized membrane protein HdeD (DUF308 family)